MLLDKISREVLLYRMLVKYVAILNRAILWFISSKKVHITYVLNGLVSEIKKFKRVFKSVYLKEIQLKLVKTSQKQKKQKQASVLLMK